MSLLSSMNNYQKKFFLLSSLLSILIIFAGFWVNLNQTSHNSIENYSINMTIKEMSSVLEDTPKSIAKELNLPIDIDKKKTFKELNITTKELDELVEHSLSHKPNTIKYYIYFAISLWGLSFLLSWGMNKSTFKYSHWPYNVALITSVALSGFLLGKSPNPMESIVKVFKSFAGLYPDTLNKILFLMLFGFLAIVGNKIICGWACPFGSLQELIYKIPLLKKLKRNFKLPFILSNSIRISLFILTMLVLFGMVGNKPGFVLYHYMNTFNLFDLNIQNVIIFSVVVIILLLSVILYRPYCQVICPFGLFSWILEKISIFKIKVDKDKCINCGACTKSCPTGAMNGILEEKRLPADCFSCYRCINSCNVNAISYKK